MIFSKINALTYQYNDIMTEISNSPYSHGLAKTPTWIILVLFDFSKLSISFLLSKLHALYLSSIALKWFQSFFPSCFKYVINSNATPSGSLSLSRAVLHSSSIPPPLPFFPQLSMTYHFIFNINNSFIQYPNLSFLWSDWFLQAITKLLEDIKIISTLVTYNKVMVETEKTKAIMIRFFPLFLNQSMDILLLP